jgi:hypothetical protein
MPVSRMPRVTLGKRSFGAALVLGLLLAPVPALAYPTFPGAMQEQLGIECPPSCLLCHTRIEGGKGFVKGEPSFVDNLRAVGRDIKLPVLSDDAEQFKKLLERYAVEPCLGPGTPPCSSDGDATSDIEELKANRDPDRAGDAQLAECVLYGCGAHIAPKASTNVSGSSAGAVCALLGALVVFGRRARRRSRA